LDLKNVDFSDVKNIGTLTVKSRIAEFRKNFVDIKLKELENHFSRYNVDKFEQGDLGLYVQPFVTYYQTRFWIFMLDVEHKSQHHQSVKANINTAQNLFYLFDNLDIAGDLIISLTGNGFRFEIPCLIPTLYSEAFLEMVKDTDRFPGIDPSPQLNSSFMRMVAYRGNKRQADPPKDVHVHILENPQDVVDLNEEKYRALVAGRPKFKQSCKDLSRMVPQRFAPQPLIRLLEDYNIKIRLRSTIGMPKAGKFRSTTSANMDQIMSFLEESGITWIGHEWSEGTIYKLDTCPACGESEGRPYINPISGVLKCWRANNCPAGQKGLRPSQWVDGYNDVETESTPEDTALPKLTIEEARCKANQAIEGALESGDNIVLNATMGVGKTHIAIARAVPAATEKLILFTVPTTELAEEIVGKVSQKALDLALDINIRHIVGRNSDNCNKPEKINLAAEKGYTPAYVECVGCDHRKDCEYLAQFKAIPKEGIIITTHHTAAYHKERISPDIWVIDESAVNQFFGVYKASQADMNQLQELETTDVGPLFDKIRDLAIRAGMELKQYEEARLYVGHTPPGQWEDAFTLENILQKIKRYFDNDILPTRFSLHHAKNPENEFQWERIAYKEKVQLEAVKFWDQAIFSDDNALAYVKVSLEKGVPSIQYTVVKYNPPQLDNCQVIHLDGTVYGPEVDMLLPSDTKTIDAQVNLDSCSKTFVKLARGKTRMLKFDYQKKYSDMEYLLRFLRPGDKKVLVITHMNFEGDVLRMAEKIRPDIEFGSFHFWGPRGINAFEDYDACISYGTPTVNSNSVSDIAMMMFEDPETIEAWKASLGERDLAQAIHRIRPVNGRKNIIVMGSYWPAQYLGHPDQRFDLMRKGGNKEEAKKRLQKFAMDYGFLTKAAAMLVNVATRDDEQSLHLVQGELARRTESDRSEGGSEFVSTLIYTYKSGDKFQGGLPAIYLAGNNSWKWLMDEIHAETGLPYMRFRPKGPGRESLSLGNVDAAAAFHEKIGTRFDSSEYREFVPG